MEDYSPQTDLLKAISHPTRLAVLEILRDGEQCVCHMEAMLGIRQSSISQQLMVLRKAEVVEVRRDSNNMYYRVVLPGVLDVLDAVYKTVGKPEPITHRHAKHECPCPKCNADTKSDLIGISISR